MYEGSHGEIKHDLDAPYSKSGSAALSAKFLGSELGPVEERQVLQ